MSEAPPRITSGVTLEGASFAVDGDNYYRTLAVGGTENVTINDIVLEKGYSGSGVGGAILKGGSGTLTITNSTIRDSSVGGGRYGGGLYMREGAIVIRNSSIYGNSANSGGGLYIEAGCLTIVNTTLYDNRATGRGAAIRIQPGASGDLTHVTVHKNRAGSGSSIRNNGTLRMTNSIVSGTTTDGSNRTDDCSGSTPAPHSSQ